MSIIDLLFPKKCIGCGAWWSYICSDCIERVVYIEMQRCGGCEKYTQTNKTHEGCKKEVYIEAAISIIKYEGIVRDIITRTKYSYLHAALEELVLKLMPSILVRLAELNLNCNNSLLQPIPLHTKRLKSRGFNQSYIIAKIISEQTHIPLINIVDRHINTQPQALLGNKKQRSENVRGAFRVKKLPLHDDTVILVDDVYTTGSTCKEVAKELYKYGYKSIVTLTIAHG